MIHPNQKVYAIIPARGGSKGIPGKNIRPLLGKPMITYAIEAAKASGYVDEVFVTTDDPQIASVSLDAGAKLIQRSSDLAGDTASSESALLHALAEIDVQGYGQPYITVFLQCTSPLTLPEDIDGTIDELCQKQADSALSVVRSKYFLWQEGADGNAEGINHDKQCRLMRQQMAPQYLETGAVYAFLTQGFLIAQHRFFGKTVFYEMPHSRYVDIDEPLDLDVAEMKLRGLRMVQNMRKLPETIDALVLDFDGVMTDNRVVVFEDGREAVLCSREDGMGLSLLSTAFPIPVWVISTEVNPVVQARCQKLGIPCLQGVDDKLAALTKLLSQHGLALENTVYVGNDVNDLACLEAVGCPVVVADAHPDLKKQFDFQLLNKGGQGAVRELTDMMREHFTPKLSRHPDGDQKQTELV